MFWLVIFAIVIIFVFFAPITPIANNNNSVAPKSYAKPLNATPMYNDDNGWSADIPQFVRYDVFYRNSPFIRAKCSSFTVIDFETANAYPDSACQIGIVLVKNNQIIEKHCFHIKPPYRTFNNTYIHKISYRDVQNALPFDELWPRIRPFIEGQIVAAYNLNFDAGCLEALWKCYSIKRVPYAAFDILVTAQETWPRYSNHKLDTMTDKLDISHKPHNAGSDAIAAANIQIIANEKDYKSLIMSRDFKDAFFKDFKLKNISTSDLLAEAKKLSQSAISNLVCREEMLMYLDEIINRNELPKLTASAYRTYAEFFEAINQNEDALNCYRYALSFYDKIGVKTKIKNLEKQLSRLT